VEDEMRNINTILIWKPEGNGASRYIYAFVRVIIKKF
jgi:hypothetical protein